MRRVEATTVEPARKSRSWCRQLVVGLFLGMSPVAIAQPDLISEDRFSAVITVPLVEDFEAFALGAQDDPMLLSNATYSCNYPYIDDGPSGHELVNNDEDPPTGRVFTDLSPGSTLFGVDLHPGNPDDVLRIVAVGNSGILEIERTLGSFNGFVGIEDPLGIISVTFRNFGTENSVTNYGFDNVTTGRLAAERAYLDVTTLPDINDNGSPEVAALSMLPDGTPQVIIKDTDTKQTINEFPIAESDDIPTGIAPVLDIDGNGYPEVAVLFVQPDGRGRVVIKDAMTASWVNQIKFFNGDWQVKAITSQDLDLDGVSEISVMAVRDDGTTAVIQIKDSMTDEPIKWIGLPVD